ncbi:MAG: lipase family protein [Aeromicrobium sp.]|uniref:alpha/beta hydrolase n=1 Tax=Aeromicrobium sp. TaxID=1871063 RepID=UPI0039E6278E
MDACGQVVGSQVLDPVQRLDGSHHAVSFAYATVGARGEPRTATASLHLPAGVERPPVLVFCHGTSGVGEQCAVSFGLAAWMGEDLAAWTAAGLAVLAVDYAGLGSPGPHAYLHARSTAFQVVDALRAAHLLADLDPRWVAMGGSQGGHAALAASSYAVGRADGLDLRGVVAQAPPTDLTLLLRAAGPWVPRLPVPDLVAYLAYILHGLEAARPELRPLLDDLLTDDGRELVDSSPWYAYQELVARTRGRSVGSMTRRGLRGTEVLRAVGETSTLPAVRHPAPVLVQQGVLDPVVPVFGTHRYVRRCRRAGSSITHRVYPAAHAVWPAARAEALRFSVERMAE